MRYNQTGNVVYLKWEYRQGSCWLLGRVSSGCVLDAWRRKRDWVRSRRRKGVMILTLTSPIKGNELNKIAQRSDKMTMRVACIFSMDSLWTSWALGSYNFSLLTSSSICKLKWWNWWIEHVLKVWLARSKWLCHRKPGKPLLLESNKEKNSCKMGQVNRYHHVRQTSQGPLTRLGRLWASDILAIFHEKVKLMGVAFEEFFTKSFGVLTHLCKKMVM